MVDHPIANAGEAMREAVREFADRLQEAALNCCIDPDAGPECSTSVSFTGDEGAKIAHDIHAILSLLPSAAECMDERQRDHWNAAMQYREGDRETVPAPQGDAVSMRPEMAELLHQPSDAADAEDAAWTWIESKYLNVELGHDPNDRDYSADEMVDAFIAGMGHIRALPLPANAQAEDRVADDATTIEILRRALAWHGDPSRMATTREEWQQVVDEALVWVRANPEEGRPSFPNIIHHIQPPSAPAAPIIGGGRCRHCGGPQ